MAADSETPNAGARIAELERMLAAERERVAAERAKYETRIADLTHERDALRQSHARLREELELLKRRLFVAKAERIDTLQLQRNVSRCPVLTPAAA